MEKESKVIEPIMGDWPKTLDDLRNADNSIIIEMGNLMQERKATNYIKELFGVDYSYTAFRIVVQEHGIAMGYYDKSIYNAGKNLKEKNASISPTDIHTISINDMKISNSKRRYFNLSEEAISFIDGLDNSRMSSSELVNFCVLFVGELIKNGKIEIRNKVIDLFKTNTK